MPETNPGQDPKDKSEAPTLHHPPFVLHTGTLGEGITGTAEGFMYLPMKDFDPVGLGEWPTGQPFFDLAFPPKPKQWVIEPKQLTYIAVKLAHAGSLLAKGQLFSERMALLTLQNQFAESAVGRPALLFGYGIRKRTDQPYLILENLVQTSRFKNLEDYLAEKGTLSEKEALEIAIRLAFILDKAHSNNIVYNDLAQRKNMFWNPYDKRLRLIDWGNAVFPKREEAFGHGKSPITYGRDRGDLGKLLFRMITGKDYALWPPGSNEQYLAKMSRPVSDVIKKVLLLDPNNYGRDEPEGTGRMLADLKAATVGSAKR